MVVEASDPDGGIKCVELYIDNILVRQDNQSPYEWGSLGNQMDDALMNLAEGSYQLRATAVDNEVQNNLPQSR